MMKTKIRKFLVAALSVTMIMGSFSTVFAEEVSESETATGEKDQVMQKDVFAVVLPAATGYFDYILDPGHVISQTNAAKYGGKTFKDAKTQTMFFPQEAKAISAGEVSAFQSNSARVKATNKSTGDVTITVAAKAVSADEVKISTYNDSGLTSTVSPEIAFQVNTVTKGDGTAPASGSPVKIDVPATGTVSMTDTIISKSDAYEVTIANGEYVKQLKKDYVTDNSAFKTYAFELKGQCNAQEDLWRDVETLPKVDLVWTVNGASDNDNGAATARSPKVTLSKSGLITITGLTKDKNLTANFANEVYGQLTDKSGPQVAIGAYADWRSSGGWTLENGGGQLTAQLHDDVLANWKGKDVTIEVKFPNNGGSITCSQTLD